MRKNIAVFVSGRGTNLQAIIDRIRRGALSVRLVLVVSDRRKAFALTRAKKAGVKTVYVDPKIFPSRQDYERHLVALLKKEKVDLVILAGFMRILSPYFIRRFKNRILNIHPALLPAFRGAHAIRDAFRYGAKVTGVTVHLVDEKVDNGPVLMQEPVVVLDSESVGQLEARIHNVEHKIYSEAIEKIATRRFSLKNRKIHWL